uniref:Uncharacterized protein n=1 Tax=Parastrongyloides trichosuri TaxID=131310 RepID=A0A0N4ZHL0_PARTI
MKVFLLNVFAGLFLLNIYVIYGGIVKRNNVKELDPKIWEELALFEKEKKIVAPELWKHSPSNDNEPIGPYKINKDYKLDINYKSLDSFETTPETPTLWSFMDSKNRKERIRMINEEVEDPFKLEKK